jgi:hypothetical protein
MARLPIPGGDNGSWGDILNEYLSESHNNDGTLKSDSVGTAQLQDDAVTANQIVDGSITEVQLDASVQAKLNTGGNWNTLANKPAVIAAGATQADARTAINAQTTLGFTPENTSNRNQASGYAGLGADGKVVSSLLPSSQVTAYLDPRNLPDGSITALTKGTFAGSFGNSLCVVSSGKIVHTPSGTGAQAGYLQAAIGQPITRIGCVAYWPAGAAGAICLAIPSTAWTYPINGDANIHVVVDGAGVVNAGRFGLGIGTVETKFNRMRPFATGSTHTIEVLLNHADQRVIVMIDGNRVLNFVDADYFTNLSTYAVWELFETTETTISAQFLSVWADGATTVVPPASQWDVLGGAPTYLPTGAVVDSSSGTYTTAVAATYESLSIAPALSFYWPESGKVLASISVWCAVAGGDLLIRANGAGGAKVAAAGFTGRVNYDQVLTGTHGGSVVSLTWQAYMTAGSVTMTKGGSIGTITVSVKSLDF